MDRLRHGFTASCFVAFLSGCIAAAPQGSTGYADDADDVEEDWGEPVVSADSPADDPHGYHEFTYVAESILRVANTIGEAELIDGAGISSRAARAIAEQRATGRPFALLAELDELPRSGRAFFNHLRDYAEAIGFLGRCGDGIVQGEHFDLESCDDGNTVLFDGCSDRCMLEPNEPCHGRPAVCGDGLICPGEICDDGNTSSNDGCTETCEAWEALASSDGNSSFSTARVVPHAYHRVAGSLTRSETEYFTVYVAEHSFVKIWKDDDCARGLVIQSVADGGTIFGSDNQTGFGVCSYLDLHAGTHTLAVHSYWLGTQYDDEDEGIGDFLFGVEEFPSRWR